ncbi:MAG: hypothetical protein GXP04_07240 [Alphaproteobacteria bacterium]|nr:hypothetical protein [Alphaproteobacteria bacterium]
MSIPQSVKLPVWFWIIAGIALMWNLMGVASYFIQVTMSTEAITALPDVERALYDNTPVWATASFAIAVFSGVAGCILLLLRKRLAIFAFGLSLISITLQMSYWLLMTNSIEIYGPGGATMPILVIVVGGFLLWFSMSSKAKGWLR